MWDLLLSETYSNTVHAILAEAADMVALEQIAKLNTAHLTDDSALPSTLESRFRKLKSLPAAAAPGVKILARSVTAPLDTPQQPNPTPPLPPPAPAPAAFQEEEQQPGPGEDAAARFSWCGGMASTRRRREVGRAVARPNAGAGARAAGS